jgi:hypothetical protein
MMPPDQIYACYLTTRNKNTSWSALCNFYHEINYQQKTSIPEFHIMIDEMIQAFKYGKLWNDYRITLRPGLIDGQCNQRAEDRKTLPKGGYKYLQMMESDRNG